MLLVFFSFFCMDNTLNVFSPLIVTFLSHLSSNCAKTLTVCMENDVQEISRCLLLLLPFEYKASFKSTSVFTLTTRFIADVWESDVKEQPSSPDEVQVNHR